MPFDHDDELIRDANELNVSLSAKVATGLWPQPNKDNLQEYLLWHKHYDHLVLDAGVAVEQVIAFISECTLDPRKRGLDACCDKTNNKVEIKTNHIFINPPSNVKYAESLHQEIQRLDRLARRASRLIRKFKGSRNNKVRKKMRSEFFKSRSDISKKIFNLAPRKFTMGGIFSKLSKNSWKKYTEENVIVLVALMINERIIAVIEFPASWKDFVNRIEKQIKRRPRDVSFSLAHYKRCPDIKLRYCAEMTELNRFKFLFTKNGFDFIEDLAQKYFQEL